eukprot:scaffold124285_cov18-Tisochrysis_lutea.AAC.1
MQVDIQNHIGLVKHAHNVSDVDAIKLPGQPCNNDKFIWASVVKSSALKDPQGWKKSRNRVVPEPAVLERHESRPLTSAAEGAAPRRHSHACHDKSGPPAPAAEGAAPLRHLCMP